jgi:sulfonate transport system permease protein
MAPAIAPARRAWRGLRGFEPWAVPLLLLVVWELASSFGLISPRFLPPPQRVVTSAVDLTLSGELPYDIVVSTARALVGFVIGGSIGLVLGLVNGTSRIAARYLDSTLQMLRTIPHLALIPLAILWFGIGEAPKIFLVALGSFFPIYINTYFGIRSVPTELLEMGRVYGLRRHKLFQDVILPGAMPAMLLGVRYALGVMWLTLIVAETIATDKGIGFMTMNAREFLQTDVVLLGIVIYALLGKLADWGAVLLERWLLPWQSAGRGA